LPRGVEDLLFSMLEKKPDARPPSARDVSERLAPFRSAVAAPRPSRPRETAPPPTPRMAHAPAPVPNAPRTDTAMSARPDAGAMKPRTDTVALVDASAAKGRELPTWLAVIAIVLLSLVAGMATYLVRLKSNDGLLPAPTASFGKATEGKRPEGPSGTKQAP
jgi:hypothetical protein